MSENTGGTIKLAASLPDVSQLTDLFGQIKSGVDKIEIPGLPLDQIKRLADGFQIKLPDTSGWSSVIPPDVTELLKKFPDPADLAKPLGEPLGRIRNIFSVDLSAEMAAIRQTLGPAGEPALDNLAAFLNSLFAPLSGISRWLKDSELTRLAIEIGKLFGAKDAARLAEEAPGLITRFQTLLQEKVGGTIIAITAAGAAATITSKTGSLVRTISGSFSIESADARFQTLLQAYGSGATSIAAQIRALDLVDSAQVAGVRGRLSAVNDAFQEFYAGLVRDLAFSEAGLALLNVDLIQRRFKQIQQSLATIDGGKLKAMADDLKAAIEKAIGSIKFDSEMDIGGLKATIKSGLAQLRREVDRLDPSGIQNSIQEIFAVINEPFKKFEEIKVEIEAIVRGAFQAVRETLEKIDLSPLRNGFDQAMGSLEKTLDELDQIFTQIRTAIDDSLKQVKLALESARNFILDPNDGLKKKIEDLFNGIFQIFEALNLKEIVGGISQSVQGVSQELVKIEFSTVIDGVVDAIEVVAEILKTVAPLLVTEDLKQKLVEATNFLRKIDFDQISAALTDAFDEILESIDTDAFAEIKQGYQKVIEAVDKFDPSPMLESIQQEVFDPLIAELEKAQPASLLQPVQDGFDKASDALKGFDPSETFSFITDFFDDLTAKFKELSPQKLLEPIEKALDEIRASIRSVLRIEEIDAAFGQATGAIMPLIDSIQAEEVFNLLESGYAGLRAALDEVELGDILSTPAAVLRGLFSQLNVDLDAGGMMVLVEMIGAKGGGLGARLAAIAQSLKQSQAQIERLDLKNYLSVLRARHDEVRASLAVHSDSDAVKARLTADVQLFDPMPVLSPLIPKADRVRAAFAGKSEEFGRTVQSLSAPLQAIDGVLDGFGAFLSPFGLLKQTIMRVFGKLFPGESLSDPKEMLARYLEEINPAQWRDDLEPLLAGIQTKLKAMLDGAVIKPLRETLDAIKSKIDLLDISFLREAIEGVFAEVEAAIQQFNPAPFIEKIDETYRRVLSLLEKLNPADFIAEVDRLYTEDVVGVVKAISPRDLLLPVLQELFQKIKGMLVELDIEVIFKPVLERLRDLETQLQEGLARAGAAFDGLVNALPTGGSASVSVSISAEVG
jgi:hypothetical protein